ncbi:MAG TPA: hypothetical protein VFK58_01625 [Sphingomicrobium sp.]|nr:hypothetical protein [Sphingomicrobium sp.]
MRAILLVLILAVAALIVLVATGLVDINQVRPARAPDIDASRSGVTASGGQAPAFDVETGTVTVGSQQRNVAVPVPTVKVSPANDQAPAAATTNAAQ